jgi:hypothetical protein
MKTWRWFFIRISFSGEVIVFYSTPLPVAEEVVIEDILHKRLLQPAAEQRLIELVPCLHPGDAAGRGLDAVKIRAQPQILLPRQSEKMLYCGR